MSDQDVDPDQDAHAPTGTERPCPCAGPGMVDALVASALDDLDDGRLPLDTTLRTVAAAAWTVGFGCGGGSCDG